MSDPSSRQGRIDYKYIQLKLANPEPKAARETMTTRESYRRDKRESGPDTTGTGTARRFGAPGRSAAQATGIEISLWAAIAVTAFTILFQVCHVTPGGIGVYEASMTGAFYALGIPWEEGLALSLLTHGLQFAYSYTVAAAFTLALFRFFDALAIALILSIYYHLRISTSWFNFTRFWRMVLENPDSTSGNFLKQIPKLAILVLAFQMLVEQPTIWTFTAVEGFVLAVAITGLLLHQWFFTWPPAPSLVPTRLRATDGKRISRRFITIVIDGRRSDRSPEADTPLIDKLRREGVDYTGTSTVYPARTVTGFSSVFTGAPPRVHGMSGNFVPSLGVKCESIFDALLAGGLTGKLVGISHLVDALGEADVETVTAVTPRSPMPTRRLARQSSPTLRPIPAGSLESRSRQRWLPSTGLGRASC